MCSAMSSEAASVGLNGVARSGSVGLDDRDDLVWRAEQVRVADAV